MSSYDDWKTTEPEPEFMDGTEPNDDDWRCKNCYIREHLREEDYCARCFEENPNLFRNVVQFDPPVYSSGEEYNHFEKRCPLEKCGHALEDHVGGTDNEGSYRCSICDRYCQAGGQWFDMAIGEWRD